MSKRYRTINYDVHAERQLAQRGISKALVEEVVQSADIRYPSRGALVAEALLPNKEKLALKVVFIEHSATDAYVITAYLVPKSRTRLP